MFSSALEWAINSFSLMFIRCEVPGTHAAASFAGTSAPAPLDGKLYVLIIKQ